MSIEVACHRHFVVVIGNRFRLLYSVKVSLLNSAFSTDGKMAYQLRTRKRPVSYVDKTDWKVPRRPKQKKNEDNLYPIEVVEKDEENSR